jgi:8-oxo-dGTP diphosphatase
MPRYKNPAPTIDLIIEIEDERKRPGIILIKRGHYPPGWALPGGFVEYGETLEQAAVREAEEETGLRVKLLGQFHTYSDPARDPRKHTISTVFLAKAKGTPKGGDDARLAAIFTRRTLPAPLAFDHAKILADYYRYKSGRARKTGPPLPRGGTHGQT